MTTANWKNRTLFNGDNLEFMQNMNSSTVDLIATDPPVKKGKDLYSTPDSLTSGNLFEDSWEWHRDVTELWLDKLKNDAPNVMNFINGVKTSSGSDIATYLCFMGIRLIEMHRILKDTGSIYLHCEPVVSHYLKALMDVIFDKSNFQNEIIWYYRRTGRHKRRYSKIHEVILFYTKSSSYTFNLQQEIEQNSKSRESICSNRPYLHSMCDVWGDFPQIISSSKESLHYITQKPIALYERIIKTSSNKNEIVFDPFCGCATTLVAAERSIRQWVGIDLWEKSPEIIMKRLLECEVSLEKQHRTKLDINEEITFTENLPVRSDDGKGAIPILQSSDLSVDNEPGPLEYRKDMKKKLIREFGNICQGCYRKFDHESYLVIDHIVPRSQGGCNHISNRTLLCGPCNIRKGDKYTLKGLRKENKRIGFM